MSYIAQADIIGQISNAQLIQLTDDDRTGLVDAAKVDKAISDAESEINGYVATRYAVPVAAPVPDLVKKLATDIAVYSLWRRRQKVPEIVRTAYEDAMKKLSDISKGVITLGIDPAPAPST